MRRCISGGSDVGLLLHPAFALQGYEVIIPSATLASAISYVGAYSTGVLCIRHKSRETIRASLSKPNSISMVGLRIVEADRSDSVDGSNVVQRSVGGLHRVIGLTLALAQRQCENRL